MRVERAPVLGLGDREHPPHPARHEHVEVAPDRPASASKRSRRRCADDEIAVALASRGCAKPPSCARRPAARLAVLGQEVFAGRGEGRVNRRRIDVGPSDVSARAAAADARAA